MIACLAKVDITATVRRSPISTVLHQTTNALLDFTVRGVTTSSRSLVSQELTWTTEPPQLKRISKTAIPHKPILLMRSMTVKLALLTTTARKAQDIGTCTPVQMDLYAQLDKLTQYLAHQAFSVKDPGPQWFKRSVLPGITAPWAQPTLRNAALLRSARKVAQIT
jgi:hypothetical protein